MQIPLLVEPDWVIGYHFASSAVPDVIYEIRSNYPMTGMPYTVSQLSRAFTPQIYDDVMTLGSSHKRTIISSKFLPNIVPHVTKGMYLYFLESQINMIHPHVCSKDVASVYVYFSYFVHGQSFQETNALPHNPCILRFLFQVRYVFHLLNHQGYMTWIIY